MLEISWLRTQMSYWCNFGGNTVEKKETYTPTEAKRAYDQLDKLVAEKSLTPDRRGHIAATSRAACAWR